MNAQFVHIFAKSSKYKLSDKRGFIIELAILCACMENVVLNRASV